MRNPLHNVQAVLLLVGIAWILLGAHQEFYKIAWGTGSQFGEFSPAWSVLFLVFTILCIVQFVLLGFLIWRGHRLPLWVRRILFYRERLGNLRAILVLLMVLFAVWFFQYTPWGLVFRGIYFRLWMLIALLMFVSVIMSQGGRLIGWRQFLAVSIVTIGAFSIAVTLKPVNDYPFSLGWSEGNRLWDYSVLFGSARYDHAAGKSIPVLLEFGRQLVGAVPFIFPHLTITAARLWVAVTLFLPYLLLGLAAFRGIYRHHGLFLVAALWTFLFLRQGPINPSLLLIAALVVLAWRSPLKYAIPLILIATFYAVLSRFTWLFAPAIWIVMLEFASGSFLDKGSAVIVWRRSASLGLCGGLGAVLFPGLTARMLPQVVTVIPAASSAAGHSARGLPGLILQQISDQPLLWYRLFPNSTYGYGILAALIIAILPLCLTLCYLLAKKIWQISALQKLSLILPMMAFFGVGLIVSTKIGGGGDLHNMDMFLIGLFFCALVAWQQGAGDWLQSARRIPFSMKMLLLLLAAISPIPPLMGMRPSQYNGDLTGLLLLTGARDHTDLELLPPSETVSFALETIRDEVEQARQHGEILFIDQRQLLTFGYIETLPLVAEYEKKVLMNNALSADAAYFEDFYADLAMQRYSLIISQPLSTPIKNSSFHFGEENNAWVKWVAIPILCYYEPLQMPWHAREQMKDVNVQLLVPKGGVLECDGFDR